MDRPFSRGREAAIFVYTYLDIQLPEQLVLLLAAAKDILRHLDPLGDGEGFQIPAADQRRPAEGGL